jgi:hypothetical protein
MCSDFPVQKGGPHLPAIDPDERARKRRTVYGDARFQVPVSPSSTSVSALRASPSPSKSMEIMAFHNVFPGTDPESRTGEAAIEEAVASLGNRVVNVPDALIRTNCPPRYATTHIGERHVRASRVDWGHGLRRREEAFVAALQGTNVSRVNLSLTGGIGLTQTHLSMQPEQHCALQMRDDLSESPVVYLARKRELVFVRFSQ